VAYTLARQAVIKETPNSIHNDEESTTGTVLMFTSAACDSKERYTINRIGGHNAAFNNP
jgi:hypothetical protein